LERNLDMLYLLMVVVFLVAGILLLFWNRGREKKRTEQMRASGMVPLEKSHLPTRRPKIKKRSDIDASGGKKMQGEMWYYSIDGSCKHGPITEEELCRLLSSRRLLPDTLVWTRELPYWHEASSLKKFDNLELTHGSDSW
jgi:hypothetical protein